MSRLSTVVSVRGNSVTKRVRKPLGILPTAFLVGYRRTEVMGRITAGFPSSAIVGYGGGLRVI